MKQLFLTLVIALSTTNALAQGWVCYGTPLNNPMGRRICGQAWDEFSARNQCGFDLVNISCQQSF